MADRRPNPDSFEYVNSHYGKSFARNCRVKVSTDEGKTFKEGTATKATHHVYVRVDGEKHANPYHPDDVTRID